MKLRIITKRYASDSAIQFPKNQFYGLLRNQIEIFFSYNGSSFNGEAHGFGRNEQSDYTHTGWFENGKAFGFGTRFYKNGSIDIGHWEVESLVQVAKFYPNGLKTQMEFLFGPGTKAFKTQGLYIMNSIKI